MSIPQAQDITNLGGQRQTRAVDSLSSVRGGMVVMVVAVVMVICITWGLARFVEASSPIMLRINAGQSLTPNSMRTTKPRTAVAALIRSQARVS